MGLALGIAYLDAYYNRGAYGLSSIGGIVPMAVPDLPQVQKFGGRHGHPKARASELLLLLPQLASNAASTSSIAAR